MLRQRRDEWMDQADVDPRLHRQALRALARINWLSRSADMLWPVIRRAALQEPWRTLRVLDLACGGGDVTVALAKKAAEERRNVALAGCDRSDTALALADDRAKAAGVPVDFFARDVLHGGLPDNYDVLMCSLFLHHLEEAEAVDLLAQMRQAARRLVLVNDLRRTRVGYFLAVGAAYVLTRSPVVRRDGPLSVQGAFTVEEVLRLAERAGLQGARVTPHWPQRFLLEWHAR